MSSTVRRFLTGKQHPGIMDRTRCDGYLTVPPRRDRC